MIYMQIQKKTKHGLKIDKIATEIFMKNANKQLNHFQSVKRSKVLLLY